MLSLMGKVIISPESLKGAELFEKLDGIYVVLHTSDGKYVVSSFKELQEKKAVFELRSPIKTNMPDFMSVKSIEEPGDTDAS